MQGKICESVHKTVSVNLHAQEKLCKGVNRVSSARKNDLQHFTVSVRFCLGAVPNFPH